MILLLAWLVLGFTVYYILRYLWELIPITGLGEKAILITGCDSGFGRLLAHQCAKNGIFVFAGCFTSQGLQSLVAESSGLTSRIRPLMLDVTKDASVKEALEIVKADLPPGRKLWAVVNNAGLLTAYGPDDWSTMDDYQLSLNVNALGVIRVTQFFKPLLKQSKGRVITVTSVCGRISIPAFGPYSVGKYAAEAYMDTIRQELKMFDIKCCILEPGVFKTPMTAKEPMVERMQGSFKKLTDEQRTEYGETYANLFIDNFSTKFFEMASPRLDYVVDNYYHAITARYPRARYRCGWDSLFMLVPVTYLPTAIVDYFLYTLFTIDVLPAAIGRRRAK